MKETATLLVSCPDRKGITAAVADFIAHGNGNIINWDEHLDADLNLFLIRVEWELAGFSIPIPEFAMHFQPVAQHFEMQWRVSPSSYRPKIAIFVSRYDHCLADLLYRQHTGELACEIPFVISNHPDAQRWTDFYKIPLHVIPVTKENKPEAERHQLELLRPAGVDLIVLARYMQVLSSDFIRQFPSHHIINIHHSFLPAFVGGKPHQQAFDRGVKLVGATSHYVTEVLDDALSSSRT